MKSWRQVSHLLVVMAILWGVILPAGASLANMPAGIGNPSAEAQTILNNMTPEERVAQLFLVTFKGKQVGDGSQIYDLITQHHIGGVVLSAANDNFSESDKTASDAYQMISQLQQDGWTAAQPGDATPQANAAPGDYIPLFIGISQEGDGSPNDQILSGLTTLPNEMAIGATWQPDLANKAGEVLGRELESLGINLLLGPSLDVLDQLPSESGGSLGTRTFGGDPYWVGEMGKSYISGVHQGSNQRIAVIAKYFPGRGGSDRLPEDEIATVRKSLEQLKQVELYPFFDVTGNAPDSASVTDGLLVSHIRYQGFQGNIRATTKPISFDAAALAQLLGLNEFATWRTNGGVVVTDDLGSRAVRRFYDPTMQTFDIRQVARDAFLAGNDILYADNFQSTGDEDSYTSILRTLNFFSQKYREDSAFAQRVDAAVTRILTLKLHLYPSFDIQQVVPPEKALADLNSQDSQQVTFDIARQAVTLMSPGAAELDSVLPQPPSQRDRILFITDSVASQQCLQCAQTSDPPVDALQSVVVKLYGPSSGGRINPTRLSSYSFNDLLAVLNYVPTDTSIPPPLLNDLQLANWVVFSTLDISPERPASGALRRLLSERPDLLGNKHVIVFAFNAPYYLDATDISQLTAYYALYSKSAAFQDVAARVLFQELSPSGDLPVSVPGIGYDLSVATTPDPAQIIPLFLDTPQAMTVVGEATPEPTPKATFKVGDTLPLRTGVILDNNNHQVPDGTIVRFIMTRNGDTTTSMQVEATTVQGIARGAFRIDNPGLLSISVAADPASISDILQLDVSQGESAGVTSIAPTSPPTETPTPTQTLSPSPTPLVTPTPAPPIYPRFQDWFIAMLVIGGSSALIYLFGLWWGSLRWGLRWGLSAALGGLVAYLYLAAGLPGGESWLQSAGRSGIVGLTFLGVLCGWGAGVAWRAWLEENTLRRMRR
ncbi:MAG: hypothetical protein M1281_08505 [Chloroflexi bacterium]|nr:hypothetical protein [Chloroflexota bacterium]